MNMHYREEMIYNDQLMKLYDQLLQLCRFNGHDTLFTSG